MVDLRANLTMQVMQEVKNILKDKVYDTVIPRNVRLAEAPSFGKSILAYDKHSRGAEAYENLAKEFLVRSERHPPHLWGRIKVGGHRKAPHPSLPPRGGKVKFLRRSHHEIRPRQRFERSDIRRHRRQRGGRRARRQTPSVLPIDKIRANPKQPRRTFSEEALADLVASIKEKGVLQPVLGFSDGGGDL